jgi:FkbH-like protein
MPVTAYTVPRVAQLAARTNQFNLTGIRFDEATTAAMGGEPGHLVAGFGVVDRFGDEGVVGAVWADLTPRVWRIGNVVLSCRVLGRGIEFAIVEWIARRAAAAGAQRLVARFVRTDRNGAADGFLEKAGFLPSGEDGWCALDLAGRPDTCPTWIRLRDDER